MSNSGRWRIVLGSAAAIAAIIFVALLPGRQAPKHIESSFPTAVPSEAPRASRNRPARQPYRTAREDQRPESQTAARDTTRHTYKSKYESFMVELNGADTMDLRQLRGIGSTYAKRIVKYRHLLGGYRSKEQLKEVYGMSDSLYAAIAPHILVDTSLATTLDANKATIDELKRHPYLDYYQAKAIVSYRNRNGNFRSKEELMNVTLIDQETYNKIEQYISI